MSPEPPDRTFNDIRYDVSEHIATLTFARPEVMNAMTVDLIAETIEALDLAAQDDQVRVVIITGEGRAFSAGGDVRRLGGESTGGEQPLPPTPFQRRAWLRRTQRMILAIRQVEKPVIAAVNGIAFGGGFELALSADLILAAESAVFALPEINAGQLADAATIKLPRRIPYHAALDLLLTGRRMDAEEARRWGIVKELVPVGELMDRARELAGLLAEGPPLVFAALKEVIRRTEDLKVQEAFDLVNSSTIETVVRLYTSEDAKEGARAFAEKRKPNWKGR